MNDLALVRRLVDPTLTNDEARRLAASDEAVARKLRDRNRRRRAIDRISQVRRPPRR